ncbi:hypothetical protein CLOSYM_04167 [[Clostridium] symbiosum ATCC 14940]|uniref:Uncharacterized protein n=1 Tax=[Clostridium] symbiosum ATCC 14940 TaxID=411472 RepID=A0ABC9TSY8_CLOSY|nr:hypothetical protein CLOSYM_04167 [[Clostridium] symbiosum ATCC 14940]
MYFRTPVRHAVPDIRDSISFFALIGGKGCECEQYIFLTDFLQKIHQNKCNLTNNWEVF